jgi:signal peptidase II
MKLWFLAPVLILLDQVTKYVARLELSGQTVDLFLGAKLHLTFNTGFAFSLPAPQLILIFLAIGVSGFLVFWSVNKERTRFEQWAAILVASGAIGNAIDRILFSQVTDFLSFWTFPVFNVADVLVTLGVVVLLWGELVLKIKD